MNLSQKVLEMERTTMRIGPMQFHYSIFFLFFFAVKISMALGWEIVFDPLRRAHGISVFSAMRKLWKLLARGPRTFRDSLTWLPNVKMQFLWAGKWIFNRLAMLMIKISKKIVFIGKNEINLIKTMKFKESKKIMYSIR